VSIWLDSLTGEEIHRDPAGEFDLANLDGPLGDLLVRVETETLERGDVKSLGCHLFDLLLGQQVWERIKDVAKARGDQVIELALSWDSDLYDLHSLSWEAMHDGEDFLGVHSEFSVAVTRVVADAPRCPCPPSVLAPARVLFVVGADLDDPDIRPGAEVMGLLRDVERGQGAVNAAIIDNASLRRFEEKCRHFNPHIVHFVSHGELDGSGRGALALKHDDFDESELVVGERLMRAMRTAEELPLLVVLTGCDSAAAGEHMDSLASEMVREGIYTAIGMAGKVSDPVCRLFSRKFGHAINTGAPLVDAMTHGRRAGLQRQEERAADDHAWALPSIYLAPNVPTGYAPVNAVNTVATFARVKQYGLTSDPVFCGRRELTNLFDRVLDRGAPLEVLIAYTKDREKLGKTRLLHEFAGRALRAGHVVVMIDDRSPDKSRLPSSAVELAGAMLTAIVKTRERFGLPEIFRSAVLAALERARGVSLDLDAVPPEQKTSLLLTYLAEFKDVEIEEEAFGAGLRPAISSDLQKLIEDARDLDDESIDVDSQVVVVLGGLEHWGDACELLCRDLLSANGLGSVEAPVPVFATCSFANAGGTFLELASVEAKGLAWLRYEQLKALDEREDTLAYEWILLHPWRSDEPGSLEVYAPEAEPPEGEPPWEAPFQRHICGIPSRFGNSTFYAIATTLEEHGVLVAADDDEILRSYAAPERQP